MSRGDHPFTPMIFCTGIGVGALGALLGMSWIEQRLPEPPAFEPSAEVLVCDDVTVQRWYDGKITVTFEKERLDK